MPDIVKGITRGRPTESEQVMARNRTHTMPPSAEPIRVGGIDKPLEGPPQPLSAETKQEIERAITDGPLGSAPTKRTGYVDPVLSIVAHCQRRLLKLNPAQRARAVGHLQAWQMEMDGFAHDRPKSPEE